ncbi:serine/threonine-protein kinase/endoribonuclease IRE1b-like isoform X2 [Tasmannia lanceolata]|uniref:serine/threonine-protein kinase/endoribonuclease IRE1b-like isoform X2 n=1 Tax=Tasmannia lanceolata TaxID=3420 RepID=UPI004063DC24
MPKLRPKAITVMRHPLLWNSEKRMSFLQDVSDKVESERQQGKVESERQLQGPLSSKIERIVAIKRWDRNLGFTVIQDISSHRRYSLNCTCDLLRAIRNMLHHYEDLPPHVQLIVSISGTSWANSQRI